MDIIKGRITAAELARSHDLNDAKIERWTNKFFFQGIMTLRAHPCDVAANHRDEMKEILAKIAELAMAPPAPNQNA